MTQQQTAAERIEAWVRREFAPQYVERVVQELIDVASGTREGNAFDREALRFIFPEWNAAE